MKINEPSNIRNSASIKKRSGTASGGVSFQSFFDTEIESRDTAEAASEAVAPSSLNGMLALQEVPEDLLHKRKAISQGQLALDSLEKLRHGLLMGDVQPEMMQQLKRNLPDRAAVIDPKLAAILDEIELRLAVELAKLEVSRS